MEYIALQVGVLASELVIPKYICCTCFDILRESIYGMDDGQRVIC